MAREHVGRLALLVLCAHVNAEGDKHTPRDTSDEAFWVNFSLFLLLFFALTPGCWYGYNWYNGYPRSRVVYVAQRDPVAPAVPVVQGQKPTSSQVSSAFSGVAVQRPLLP